MTGIVLFAADRMSGYIAGGSTPRTAARFTRGELEAIYREITEAGTVRGNGK